VDRINRRMKKMVQASHYIDPSRRTAETMDSDIQFDNSRGDSASFSMSSGVKVVGQQADLPDKPLTTPGRNNPVNPENPV
jgi:hypothetical protein